MTSDERAVLAWLVAQPDSAWFDTSDVAAGSGVDPSRVYEALCALERSGDVTGYYGGSGPLMYYATTKARREASARLPIAP